jgi:hypothetical protein
MESTSMVVKLITGPMADSIDNDESVHDYLRNQLLLKMR